MNKMIKNEAKRMFLRQTAQEKKEKEKKKEGPKRGFNTPETGPKIDFLLYCQEKS